MMLQPDKPTDYPAHGMEVQGGSLGVCQQQYDVSHMLLNGTSFPSCAAWQWRYMLNCTGVSNLISQIDHICMYLRRFGKGVQQGQDCRSLPVEPLHPHQYVTNCWTQSIC